MKSNSLPDPVTIQSNKSVGENNATAQASGYVDITARNENRTQPIESRVDAVEIKPSKSVTDVFRHIDEKKIQSNTKDIEDESGNILQTRRVQIVTTTIAPSRSTLPNTFSDAGGNGGTLENVQTLGSDSVVRKRHRRRRQGRYVKNQKMFLFSQKWMNFYQNYFTRRDVNLEQPIKMVNNTYEARLERLKEELNRPSISEYLERQRLLIGATEQPPKSASTRIDDGKRYTVFHLCE